MSLAAKDELSFTPREASRASSISLRALVKHGQMFGTIGSRVLKCVSLLLVFTATLMGETEPKLLSIDAVRMMRESETIRHPKVRVRGIVTLVRFGFWIQDSSEGIYVMRDPNESYEGRLFPGQLVEVAGQVEVGNYAPMIRGNTVTVLQDGERPAPRRIGYPELAAGVGHCQLVEVQGLVRSAAPNGGPNDHPTLELMVDGRRLLAVLAHISDADIARLPDSVVRLRGAAGGKFNLSQQLIHPVIFAYDINDLTIEEPAPLHPFDVPATTVTRVRRFPGAPLSLVGRRVKVRGEVLWHDVGGELYLRDSSGGIRVLSSQDTPLHPGDEVEVLGFPETGVITPQLEDGTYRRIAPGGPPVPVETDMKEIMDGVHEADLVRLEAVLIAQINSVARERIYLVQSDGYTFRARLSLPHSDTPERELINGSRLQLTGVCVAVEPDDREHVARPMLVAPTEIQLLLRGPADILVLQPPSWWTVQHVTWVLLGTVMSALVTIVFLVIRSRREVQREATAHAETEARFAGVLSERERIARELHDSVQQGLAGVRLQLEAATMRLDGGSEPAVKHLRLAKDFIRQSEDDVRHSIWDLRPQALETADLPAALEEIARRLTMEGRLRVSVQAKGSVRRLSAALESDLLRACQEGLTNALKHGSAHNVDITISFADDRIEVRVDDDGTGVTDWENVMTDVPGHFGLRGMRERIGRHRGELRLESSVKGGASLSVEVPLP